MIEQVKDTLSDIKDKIGDKWFYLAVGGAVAFGLYNLTKGSTEAVSDSENETVYYEPSGMVGFADVGSNADVVMDNVNKTIEANTETILDFVESIMGENVLAIDELSTKVADVQTELSQELETVKTSVSDVQTSVSDVKTEVQTNVKEVQEAKQQVNTLVEKVDNLESKPVATVTATPTTSTSNKSSSSSSKSNSSSTKKSSSSSSKKSSSSSSKKSSSSSSKKTTSTSTTKTTSSSSSSSSTPKAETYTYTQKSGLNTSQSIVDALKATGADSSYSSRKAIAEANGISNYTGSYSQNVELLNKMKSGTLKKA